MQTPLRLWRGSSSETLGDRDVSSLAITLRIFQLHKDISTTSPSFI